MLLQWRLLSEDQAASRSTATRKKVVINYVLIEHILNMHMKYPRHKEPSYQYCYNCRQIRSIFRRENVPQTGDLVVKINQRSP